MKKYRQIDNQLYFHVGRDLWEQLSPQVDRKIRNKLVDNISIEITREVKITLRQDLSAAKVDKLIK